MYMQKTVYVWVLFSNVIGQEDANVERVDFCLILIRKEAERIYQYDRYKRHEELNNGHGKPWFYIINYFYFSLSYNI